MGMTIEEIRYRLQAMATMCTFQDAVGHDLSHKEIGLYNQAKDEAVEILKKYQKMQADYNSRLKADIVAMLTEIMGDITDHAVEFELFGICDTYISVGILQDIMYKKVNALKKDCPNWVEQEQAESEK